MSEPHYTPERMGLLRAVYTAALLTNVYQLPRSVRVHPVRGVSRR